ncbi:hypothetical protein SDRG_02839 [Saprolegnia diclina VS20]|uniref:Uncharacterized protein n=1 Tax=Saprolegnia diclina (strain VS20) TaxID=1156394 RepID=T0SBP3_SAPDV|nr:hypothetical protein SDRG_02839 [Saprolegnia diclina VS20]EQC40192.1 hypothetical protein SDRG_02839 [Saprolegnia diclina VS20]|eukprot:XP_008606666.1 hypothetical protein SDRG_02839 [Saprolegnia diclina VS20]
MNTPTLSARERQRLRSREHSRLHRQREKDNLVALATTVAQLERYVDQMKRPEVARRLEQLRRLLYTSSAYEKHNSVLRLMLLQRQTMLLGLLAKLPTLPHEDARLYDTTYLFTRMRDVITRINDKHSLPTDPASTCHVLQNWTLMASTTEPDHLWYVLDKVLPYHDVAAVAECIWQAYTNSARFLSLFEAFRDHSVISRFGDSFVVMRLEIEGIVQHRVSKPKTIYQVCFKHYVQETGTINIYYMGLAPGTLETTSNIGSIHVVPLTGRRYLHKCVGAYPLQSSEPAEVDGLIKMQLFMISRWQKIQDSTLGTLLES